MLDSSENIKQDLECVKKYFANIGKKLTNTVITSTESSSASYISNIPSHLNITVILPPDKVEVASLIMGLKFSPAIGWDTVPEQLRKLS